MCFWFFFLRSIFLHWNRTEEKPIKIQCNKCFMRLTSIDVDWSTQCMGWYPRLKQSIQLTNGSCIYRETVPFDTSHELDVNIYCKCLNCSICRLIFVTSIFCYFHRAHTLKSHLCLCVCVCVFITSHSCGTHINTYTSTHSLSRVDVSNHLINHDKTEKPTTTHVNVNESNQM